MTRQQRRAQERKAKKALGGNARKLMYAAAFYKDDSLTEGFSFGGGLNNPQSMEIVQQYNTEAAKAYNQEARACAEGTHPEYKGVTMDQVVFEAMENMKGAITEWNRIIYGSPTRKMGEHPIEFSWSDVAEPLWYIILGITYGELHGVIESDNYNGMCYNWLN